MMSDDFLPFLTPLSPVHRCFVHTVCPVDYGPSWTRQMGYLGSTYLHKTQDSLLHMHGELNFKILGRNLKNCGFFTNDCLFPVVFFLSPKNGKLMTLQPLPVAVHSKIPYHLLSHFQDCNFQKVYHLLSPINAH